MDNSGKSSIAFLMGIVAGGVLGLLFAPKSGKETRSDLQRYLKEAENNFAKKKAEIQEAASRQMNKLKEQVNRTFQEGKEKMGAAEGDAGEGEAADA